MEIFNDAQSDISESSPIRQMAASVSWTEIPRNRENAGFGGRHLVGHSFHFNSFFFKSKWLSSIYPYASETFEIAALKIRLFIAYIRALELPGIHGRL
ncbi:hypothetical protein QYH69_32760 [Paraburkholderia sp. SARCC-3016]|uniref:hypothetical protein n=1 Tax=Paraburkholderia sp. SARCC-3016 TaxID=3058611 RepID=UPI002806C437|nr:hypothetical protein [Paraburkholderia sp. SARCC-3016]MDQ7981997.1 hypothetical protein [Paraburkholderia sp. SARCC-3016]